jgi:hypothetical protein
MRLPRRLDLGLAVIQIRLVGKRELWEAADCEPGDVQPDGAWDADDGTIYVGRWLKAEQKRVVFWHEVKHAVNDADYWSRYG